VSDLIDDEYIAQNAAAMQYVKLSAGSFGFYSDFVPVPHGDKSFDELLKALQSAQDEIFIATWFLEPTMELSRTDWDQPIASRAATVLENVLLDRAKANVTIRILVWNFLNLGVTTSVLFDGSDAATNPPLNPIMSDVGDLGKKLAAISPSNEVVVTEHSLPFATKTLFGISFPLGGSHHQKMWIMRSGANYTAYVGGVNLRQWDWDTADHTVLDQRRNSQATDGAERKKREAAQTDPDYVPRHDWMSKSEGPAAYRVLEEFSLRWGMAGKQGLTLAPFPTVKNAGKLFVQKSHTLPIAYGGGSREIRDVYQYAIDRASKYMYFENQYWTSSDLTDSVVAAVQRVKDLQVVIVLPDKAEDPIVGKYIAGEQWFQLQRIWAAGGTDRVRVYTLYRKHPVKKATYVNVYVHAKIAIIDDLWATIGSANTNNRSMFIDTECNVQVANGPLVSDMRKSVWKEMLDDSKGDDGDPIAAIRDGFHPTGEKNQQLMKDGEDLKGLIVPLKEPESGERVPEVLRPLL
jgi:phosphatidylserine/phosphatidylglycerophosphate/cardiolipin synthase-like enzyme